jgi:hypothetical protein
MQNMQTKRTHVPASLSKAVSVMDMQNMYNIFWPLYSNTDTKACITSSVFASTVNQSRRLHYQLGAIHPELKSAVGDSKGAGEQILLVGLRLYNRIAATRKCTLDLDILCAQ